MAATGAPTCSALLRAGGVRRSRSLGYPTDTWWPSYFTWWSALLGAAGSQLVAATFYSFSPRMVADYTPAVWSVAAPEQVLAARQRAVDRAFRTLLGDRIERPELAVAARQSTLGLGEVINT